MASDLDLSQLLEIKGIFLLQAWLASQICRDLSNK